MNTIETVKSAHQHTASRLEARALYMTVLGALSMAVLGFCFAVLTQSEAILLDGFFSLIGCAIALLTQKVSHLAMRPGNQQYPFGYTTFEPILNLCKGLLLSVVGLFALISSISALFTGGRPISTGGAMAYAGVSAVGSFWIAWRLRGMAKRSRSSLVRVDAKNWMIDGVISIAVAVTFFFVELTKGTSIETWAPYADPTVVIVIVLAMVPLPINTIRDAWRQIIGYCPDSKKMRIIHAAVVEILQPSDSVTFQVRSLEIGRLLYVQVYVLDPHEWSGTLAQQDQLRSRLYSNLNQQFAGIKMDLIFTQQYQWLNWGDS